MLKPLEQFICDTCKQVIETPSDGWIEWIEHFNDQSGKYEIHSFRIVHHSGASPLSEERRDGCYQHSRKSGGSDNHLDSFLSNEYKMANILRFLDIGELHERNYSGCNVTDMRQYVNTVRRLTIPYYEEARLYWQEAKDDGYFSDANELWIYGTENLRRLIKEYGE